MESRLNEVQTNNSSPLAFRLISSQLDLKAKKPISSGVLNPSSVMELGTSHEMMANDKRQSIIYDGADLQVYFPQWIGLQIASRKEQKLTTITAVVIMKGKIDYKLALPFLRIRRIPQHILDNQPSGWKPCVPHIGIPGFIVDAIYKNSVRGYVCRKTDKYFRNCIAVDMSMGKNNINMKVLSDKVQMCGAKSREMALSAVDYIIENLVAGQQILNKIKAEPLKAINTAKWFLARIKCYCLSLKDGSTSLYVGLRRNLIHCLDDLITHYHLNEMKGEKKLPTNIIRCAGGCLADLIHYVEQESNLSSVINESIFICKSTAEMKMLGKFFLREIINKPIVKSETFLDRLIGKEFAEQSGDSLGPYEGEISTKDIDLDFLAFYTEQANDFLQLKDRPTFELLRSRINWLLNMAPQQIFSGALHSIRIKTGMVNINYKLGYRIKRCALCRLIEGTELPCRARYNPTYDSYVTIYFPCYAGKSIKDLEEELKEGSEEGIEEELASGEEESAYSEVKYCTLLVYSTGNITQSNPTRELAHDVRCIFLTLIGRIEPMIRL